MATTTPAPIASPSITPSTSASPALALSPQDAWLPLPAEQWDAAAARHLLRRASWSAQPAEVERAVAEGMDATLDRLFPTQPVAFPKPPLVAQFEADAPDFAARTKAAAPAQKRIIQKEVRERSQQAMQDMALRWLQFASQPALSAQEKWVLFLSNNYVVSYDKVRNAGLIYQHHETLRRHGLGSAATLAKAVSRSPAMIRYLDLQESGKDAPNENFARELFELFLLGEGNYTEKDIKNSARAFTGYRIRDGQFVFSPKQHDTGRKTVFGQTGNFAGDDIIDLTFRQPASATWMPHKMARFYLSDAPLSSEHLAALGTWWAEQNHELRALAIRFFGSRLFYDPAHTGNYIKSPLQLYISLLQDLHLDVTPLPRLVMNPMRQMSQPIYQPPNVRGWLGGRNWINSATLAARRQLVQTLFTPINEANLNADEAAGLSEARAAGHSHFIIDSERLAPFAPMTPAQIADAFLKTLLPGRVSPDYRAEVVTFLSGESGPNQHLARVRNTAITLLQSPEYQLC